MFKTDAKMELYVLISAFAHLWVAEGQSILLQKLKITEKSSVTGLWLPRPLGL